MRKIASFVAAFAVVLALGGQAASASPGSATVRLSGHRYVVQTHGRFGVIPQRGHVRATGGNLRYGGGIDGIGVTTGAPRVYIVYWGTQWGTASTNGSGYTTFSNDSAGFAPDQQAFFKGLGTGNELWDGVMTQYCQGVSTGATTCPASNTQHVAYPTGGALAGVWYDNASAEPSAATQAQLAAEAVRAAAHFGNTTAAANRNAQYVVTSPKGTNPDNYKTGGFCAWHDYTTSGGVDYAYTNMPYLLDVGASCGQGFVNSPGTLDGVTIVGGHEYAETITDQNPVGGWLDSAQAENGDKCAWISSGQGASQNITLTTGTFAVQSTWANDFNGGAGGCEVSHPIVTNGGGGGNDFSISASPSSVSVAQGSAASTTISTAVTSGSAQAVSLSASGLPSGVTAGFNPASVTAGGSSTLTFTASSTASTGTFTVTVTGTGSSATHSTTVSLTVTTAGGCGVTNVVKNPGFESGATSWTQTSGVIGQYGSQGEPPHGGTWDAWLDGYGSTHTDSLYQQLTIPSTACGTLKFWLHIDTAETTTTTAYDTLKVQVRNTSGTVLATLKTYSNLNHNSGYAQKSLSVSAYLGQTVRIYLLGTEDVSLQTSFVVDDFSLT